MEKRPFSLSNSMYHFRACAGLLEDGRVRNDHEEDESEARSLAQGVSYDIV